MYSGLIRYFAIILLGLASANVVQAQTASPTYDIIIRGGTVFDGSAALPMSE